MTERITLNANQARRVATILALLDETLALFEEYARGREVRSVCYQERNRLNEPQRAALLAAIERTRDLIAELKTHLQLPVHVEEIGQRIWAYSMGFLDSIAELDGKHLSGYGEMSPAVAAYLAPRAQALLRELQVMADIVKGTGENLNPSS